ncbi:MAG: PD-(D/E)XK nuclease family protein, partial [Lactobacillus iners]|nr:PD-(D/E)XK nuclease family protein [Lactobacillus iners]
FETSGFKGLYQFINFIKRMQKNKYDFSQPLSSKDAQDAIKLMTIHGSKGLEFPIVFLIGLNHKYQQADTTNNYVITTKSGLGLTITTADYRILYVGLTRAKQKLIMVSTMANENIIPDFQNKLDAHNQLPFIDKSNAISPMSFLGPELFANQVNTLCLSDIDRELDKEDKVHYIQVMQLKSQASVKISNQSRSDLSDKLLATVKTLYNFNYPFQAATTTTSYQAVSEIKKAFEYPNDKESDNSKLINSANKYLMPISDQPAFLKKANFTGAEIGTAMHLLLQYYDYTIEYSPTNVDDLIENLVLQNKLNPDIIPHLSKHDINWFVTSNFAKAFWEKSDNLYREIEFSSLISANNLFHNFNDVNDKILVHGTIDGYFIDDDGIILFDYKTDFVDRSNLELAINNLKKKYAGQLSLYASALNNLSDKKVKAKYLILLSINKIVKVD